MSNDDVRFLLIALPIPVINPNGIFSNKQTVNQAQKEHRPNKFQRK
jgi:hypothetical protein